MCVRSWGKLLAAALGLLLSTVTAALYCTSMSLEDTTARLYRPCLAEAAIRIKQKPYVSANTR